MRGVGRVWEWREAEAEAIFREAKELLDAGRVIALPTETFYALAAHPFKEAALKALFALKGRPPEKPVLLLVASPETLSDLVADLPEAAVLLIKRFWPGPLTLILPAKPGLSPLITGGTGTVGVRQPGQLLTRRLIQALGYPVTGTSANRSGQPPLAQAREVDQEFGDQVPLIVDAGPCPGGLPSTVVDLSASPPRLVRPGALESARLCEVIPNIQVAAETYG